LETESEGKGRDLGADAAETEKDSNTMETRMIDLSIRLRLDMPNLLAHTKEAVRET
jgi:hypothetical protein